MEVFHIHTHDSRNLSETRQPSHVTTHQEPVDHDEVADGHPACRDLPGGQVHDGAQRGAEDGVLPEVEHGEAVARLERLGLEGGEALVVGPGLVPLVVEVLDRLEVDERVDGLGLLFRLVVRLRRRHRERVSPVQMSN